jgi:tetratricopeptide (TPR) repeat protein
LGRRAEANTAYRQSIQLGEQVLATEPANPDYQTTLANTLLNTIVTLSAREDLREIEAMYRRAMDLITSALKTCPGCAGYQSEFALCLEGQADLYRTQGRAEEAEETALAGVELRKRLQKAKSLNRIEDRYLGRALTNLGRIIEERGRLAEADEIYDQASDILGKLTEEFPEESWCRRDLILTLRRQNFVQARLGYTLRLIESHRHLVKLDPKNAESNNSLAWIHATSRDLSLRDSNAAVRFAKAAVEAAPNALAYWNTLGVAEYRNGNMDAAIDALNRSLTIRGGGDSYDWYFLAMAHCKLGNSDLAADWYSKAAQWHRTRDPENAELQLFQAEAQSTLGGLTNSFLSANATTNGR